MKLPATLTRVTMADSSGISEAAFLPAASKSPTTAFIWGGTRVAPNHKIKAATVLFVFWLLILGGAIGLVLSGSNFAGIQFNLEGGGLAPIMAFVGAITGLYIVRKQNVAEISISTD